MNEALFSSPGDGLAFLSTYGAQLLTADTDANFVLSSRDRVYHEYGPIFREAESRLTANQFSRFLGFAENGHWTGLDRQRSNILGNFEAARREIVKLVRPDTREHLRERYDSAAKVRGFGKGIITPILHVAWPDTFGVWNDKTEEALRTLGLWIHEERGDSEGRRYEKVNAALTHARNALNNPCPPGRPPVDLWTIDYYWHGLRAMRESGRLTELVDEFWLNRRGAP